MITANFNKITSQNNIALGNHLFQYVLCRLVSEKKGYNFYLTPENYIVKCFKDVEIGVNDGEIQHEYIENFTQAHDSSIFNLHDFTNLVGYFQTEKYFLDDEDNIKSWFKVEVDSETQEVLDKYPLENYCYIHLRGGDYKITNQLLPKTYFIEAMNLVKTKYCQLSFVIITDDIELSKSYFPEIDAISNDVVTDFKSLYFSKYSIISNSSFSWWSSWLSDKIVTIAPKKWLNYNQPSMGWHPIDIETSKFIYI